MKIKDKSLALFLTTRGKSLGNLESLGMLAREIKPYQELAKDFKRIIIFSYGTNDRIYKNLFPSNVGIIDRPRFIPVVLYSFLMPIIRGRFLQEIDIFKTNQMDGSWPAVIAKKLFNKKLVVRCGYEWFQFIKTAKRSWWKRSFAYCAEKFAYGNADKIIITSEEDKEFIIENFKISPEKIIVNPNYVDTEKFKPLPVEKADKRILFVGRFETQKNLFTLFEAMKGVEAELVLIGKGSQETELKKYAKENNIRTLWLGTVSQDNLPMELNKSDIFVLPSLYEGNPKVLLEAMSCGIACVGTNVKGIREIIEDGHDGLLAEPSPESLRERVLMLLENQELRDKLGANARTKILEEYSLSIILKKELGVYQSLLHHENNI